MARRRSLRLKVALVFSALTILLLLAQALGLKAVVEAQEEKFIDAVIADDMRDLLRAYRDDAALMPVLDRRLGARVSQEGGLRLQLPASAAALPPGTHEILLADREIHVAVAALGAEHIIRIYDFSIYERHFKQGIDMLLIGTGAIALLTVWLSYVFSGMLVRQVAGLARQVLALRPGQEDGLLASRYDEIEVVELAETFNDYHRRMAEMMRREKEFTGNVSHELRTPLTTIKTSCELLAQDAALNRSWDEKSAARLRQIERASDNIEALVKALLSLARDESSAPPAPLALGAAIADTLAHFSDRMAERGITATMAIDDGLRVLADAPALAIVLSNLIDNAVRHTRQGTLRFSYADGELSIADSGSGIAADRLPLVFERFYRAAPPDGEKPGFGIGLAVVKKICERCGWSIRIVSSNGDDGAARPGTKVYLGLPPAPAAPVFTKI